MCRSSCFLFWGQSWAVGGWVLSRAAISLELTALSHWVRERKDWGNYLPLKKIDEAKCATRKQYAGSNLSPFTATVIFFLQVPAIYGVDTRMLTKIIRDKVRSSSLAESLSLLILPQCMKDSLKYAKEKTWPAPSTQFYAPFLYSSDVVSRTEYLTTMFAVGWTWDQLPWQEFIECLLCVDYDNGERHYNSAPKTGCSGTNRESV